MISLRIRKHLEIRTQKLVMAMELLELKTLQKLRITKPNQRLLMSLFRILSVSLE